MSVKRRPYRDDYASPLFKRETPANMAVAVYVESNRAWFASIRQWCVDNGYAGEPSAPIPTGDGFVRDGGGFGLMVGDKIRGDLINLATMEIRAKARAEWPEDAKALCDRHERKLFSVFQLLDDAIDAKDALDDEIHLLKAKLVDAERVTSKATDAAEEMRRRMKEVDVDRLRRDLEAEASKKTEVLLEENRQLKSDLHEATSQVTKLAEDKRRLRAALNTSKGRR